MKNFRTGQGPFITGCSLTPDCHYSVNSMTYNSRWQAAGCCLESCRLWSLWSQFELVCEHKFKLRSAMFWPLSLCLSDFSRLYGLSRWCFFADLNLGIELEEEQIKSCYDSRKPPNHRLSGLVVSKNLYFISRGAELFEFKTFYTTRLSPFRPRSVEPLEYVRWNQFLIAAVRTFRVMKNHWINIRSKFNTKNEMR